MAGRFAQRPTRTTVRGGSAGVPAQAHAPGRARVWVPDGPLDVSLVLGPLRRGPGDPTFKALPDGSVWRASLTPVGPGTLRVTSRNGEVRGEAWGPGAEWLLDRLPRMLGADDDPAAFVPRHRLLAVTRHRLPGLRLVSSGLVLESLIPSILEQKVTATEAYRAWRLLVRKFGEPAPGPAPAGMYVMPVPQTWALIPSWEWHRAGVDDKRASTILRTVRVASRMEEAAGMEPAVAQARLEAVTGVGPWTSAEVVQRSHGAPDAVTVGDLHLPGIVGWALGGDRSADDAEMLRLLEPYAGQRHRAARLVLLSGCVPGRIAPRLAPRDMRSI
ncbi:DNA-3-methyladenine glycosylase 2 family protein [Streptomyces sp. CRN 30]|uniref:DNA-3-methyladenine glycosylase family protein n=1 Tax=Streptomyces sp. CRN 30 TaxID=3075613 RepID=UPI002A80E8F8|nr:DNA-3-methyladenine glycosylase 2 family protein [Streptomyces sp. CRN 30]